MFLACAALVAAGAAPAAAQEPGFLEQARTLAGREAWAELRDLAVVEFASAGEDNARACDALGQQARAEAGLLEMEACVATLQALAERGVDPAAPLDSLGGPPLALVTDTVWSKCWANYDPDFNRGCWQALFEAFPDSPWAGVGAGRLLMAALKTGDAGAARRLEAWFADALAAAREGGQEEQRLWLTGRLLAGHLEAGHADARILGLAVELWQEAWSSACTRHGYEGPPAGPLADLEAARRRRECELDTDDAWNRLARATVLAGGTLEAGHPALAIEAEPGARFEDATAAAGLEGLRAARVAARDFDGDGDPDLCFSGRLFENEEGVFREVTKERGLGKGGAGALFGDYDGDGEPDLLVTSSPSPTLYRNLGRKGRYAFEEVSAALGLDRVRFEATPEGAAWADYDGDGDLDLYFAVYENPLGKGHPDVLLENRGKDGFADVSEESGVAAAGPWCGRGVSPCDFDLDGRLEILVSNYRLQPNLLWVRGEDGRLRDRAPDLGFHGVEQQGAYGHTIGSVWGDADGDGDLDLFCANLAHPRFVRQGFSNLSMLYLQGQDGNWSEEALTRGIRFQETQSDPAFVDYDHDGDLDLSLTCVYEGVPSALLQNDGNGGFQPVTLRSGAVAFHAWGQAWFDFDGDGFLDVLYASSSGVRLFRNLGNGNHWLRVRLETRGEDPDAFGAVVRVQTLEEDPPRTWTRQLVNARGTTSQDEAVLSFGLGAYAGRVEVRVTWPDTGRTTVRKAKPDRTLRIRRGI